jgi:hypothetical protein
VAAQILGHRRGRAERVWRMAAWEHRPGQS